MFTGIIQQIGTIREITKTPDTKVLRISPAKDLKIKEGDSLSLNGICSTVIEIDENTFKVEFMNETIKKTTAGAWKKNDKINIENTLCLSDKLNGHLVTGHVDAKGRIVHMKESDSTKEFKISYPPELSKFIAFKGSITVDGISLTVCHVDKDSFSVSLIPYTIKNTVFENKKQNDEVNLEVDIISRYLKRLFDERDKQADYEFLKVRGFI